MKEKNYKNIVILLIGLIIIVFVILCVLFATGTIQFKSDKVNSNPVTSNNNDSNKDDNSQDNTEIKILSNDGALTILKEKFNYFYKYLSSVQNPCGDDFELDNAVEQKNGMPYYRSNDFKSFEELEQELLKNMTSDIMKLRKNFVKENYLEKDGKLYCWMIGGGNLTSYDADKTEYTITNISENSIEAGVVAYQAPDPDNIISSEKIKVKLIKDQDIWKMAEYQVQN